MAFGINTKYLLERIKGTEARNKQLEKELYITENMLRGEKTGADLETLSELDVFEFKAQLSRLGITEASNPSAFYQYMHVFEKIKMADHKARVDWGYEFRDINGKVFSKINQQRWEKFVSDHHQKALIESKIEQLSLLQKDKPNDGLPF